VSAELAEPPCFTLHATDRRQHLIAVAVLCFYINAARKAATVLMTGARPI
jgi:hypothetical protein